MSSNKFPSSDKTRKSLIQSYRDKVQSGELQFNTTQSLVIEAFQLLTNRLQHYTPPLQTGFFGSLFGKSPESLKGLYLFGGVGCGKTMLMDLFFKHLSLPKKKRLHFSIFMEQVHSDIQYFRNQGSDNPIDAVAGKISEKIYILCLDEFQVTDITDAMILGRLFEALFLRGLVLVTTGNIAPQNLYQDGINRALFLPFIDLIEAHTDIIELDTSIDYRRTALGKQKLWYIGSLARDNKPYLEQWQQLIAGFQIKTMSLDVNGRNLHIPCYVGKIARFTFSDLCRQPLGRADYIALTKRFTTLFIDDIPVLDPENGNEVRRFILLIDSLYDQGILLIASAEASPDALLTTGKFAQEFKRTTSRLIEMSHKDYAQGHATP